MASCKWCLKEQSNFAKSHIIPKGFFIFDGEYNRKIIPYKGHPKKRPIGMWDNKILCSNCEKDFQSIDNLAHDILINNFENYLIPFLDQKDEVAFQIDGKHKQTIKRFLIYILWRASVSFLEELRAIELRHYENVIREELINNTQFSEHEYSFCAYKVEKSSGNFLPRKLDKKNFGGCDFYELDFANFIFEIKVDQRPTPKLIQDLLTYKNFIFMKLRETPVKRRQAMIKIINSSYYGDIIE